MCIREPGLFYSLDVAISSDPSSRTARASARLPRFARGSRLMRSASRIDRAEWHSMDATNSRTGPFKRPTIRDVANVAGVSKSLVSLVYSNPSSVSPERTQRVLDAAATLGFHPNTVARSLAGHGGDFVGVLVADLQNPVFADIVDAARSELAGMGEVSLMTSATLPGGNALDHRLLALFRDLRPRAILIVGSIPDMPRIAELATSSRIVVASAIPDRLPTALTVRGDDRAGMRLVIDHLVHLGHRDIAHVGGVGGLVAEARASAYSEAMREHGLEANVRIEAAGYSETAGYAAAARLLSTANPPTAITAVNDLAAVGALSAASEASVRVSVVGYDGTSLAGLRQISLTTVDPDNVAIGVRAAQLLTAEGSSNGLQSEHQIAPRIEVRSSTFPPG